MKPCIKKILLLLHTRSAKMVKIFYWIENICLFNQTYMRGQPAIMRVNNSITKGNYFYFDYKRLIIKGLLSSFIV